MSEPSKTITPPQPHERAITLLSTFLAGLMQGPEYSAETVGRLAAYFRALLPPADAEPTPSYDARELAERYIYLRYGSQHGGSPRQDDYAFEGPSAIRDFVAYAVTFWGVPASGETK